MLTQSLRYVAKRIDHGATFQVDAAIPSEPKAENEGEDVPNDKLEEYNKMKELAEFVNENLMRYLNYNGTMNQL